MAFNFFGKKRTNDPAITFTDKTFISTAAKMNACLAFARAEPQSQFICWFPETARVFREFFTSHGIPETRVWEARNIHAGMLQNKVPVMAEHHPLHEKEKELVRNWPVTSLTVYNALDEALLIHFGSEKIISLMKTLGMQDDEAIEHQMVSRSILHAQEKIAAKVSLEQAAHSQQEWMDRNCS